MIAIGRATRVIFLFETSCRSRTVGPRFPALAGATLRGSLAAFLWPTDRLPRRFRGSPARWLQQRRAGLRSHHGSGVGLEPVGSCSWAILYSSETFALP